MTEAAGGRGDRGGELPMGSSKMATGAFPPCMNMGHGRARVGVLVHSFEGS